MGHNHSQPTMSARYKIGLDLIVSKFWHQEVVTVGDIRDIGMEKVVAGFDIPMWVRMAKQKQHVQVHDRPGRAFRFNRKCAPVVRSAMKAGHLASRPDAMALAKSICEGDGVVFVILCQAFAETHGDQWFVLGKVYEQVCKLLDLHQRRWFERSIEMLLLEAIRLMPGNIRYESCSGGGYRFQVNVAAVTKVVPPLEPVVFPEEVVMSSVIKKSSESASIPSLPSRPLPTFGKHVGGAQQLRFMKHLAEHYRDRVIPVKELGAVMETCRPEWANRNTHGNFLVPMRQSGLLLQCAPDGGPVTSVRGYSRLNLEHPQVRELLGLTDEVETAAEVVTSPSIEASVPHEEEQLASLTAPAMEASEPSLEVTVTEVAPETETAAETDTVVQVVPLFVGFQSVAEVEAALKAKEDALAKKQERRNEITVEKAGLKARLAALETEDLAIAEAGPFDQQELIHLNQELTRLQHEAELRAAQAKLQVDELLASLAPEVVELLKARLLQG